MPGCLGGQKLAVEALARAVALIMQAAHEKIHMGGLYLQEMETGPHTLEHLLGYALRCGSCRILCTLGVHDLGRAGDLDARKLAEARIQLERGKAHPQIFAEGMELESAFGEDPDGPLTLPMAKARGFSLLRR
jgi:hypothetical protein